MASLSADSVRVELLPTDYGTATAAPALVEGAEFGATHVAFSGGGQRAEVALADLVGAVVSPMAGQTVVSAVSYASPGSSGCCGGGTSGERARRVSVLATFPSSPDGAARAERLATALWCAAQGLDVRGPRPPRRRLLAFVNPKSGPGRGVETYRAVCAPILEDGGCDMTMIPTKHAGHATEALRDMPTAELLSYAGVLAGGGDGSLHEIMQGLLARPDWATVAGRVTLGSLPTGSGNGIAASLCAAAGVPYSVVNGTLFIAKNARTPLDIASVFIQEGGGGAVPGWGERRYSFLSTAWGIIGDLDIESEALRCLGAARFDVMGLVRALVLRKYSGRLWYLPDAAAAASPMRLEGAGVAPSEGLVSESDAGVAGPAVATGQPPSTPHLRPFSEPLPAGDGWQCIEGPFTMV